MYGQRCNSPKETRGFSLLEVLVALVIFSIGLLGLAGLQLTGLRYAYNSNVRYQAIEQAIDMADRMRANMAGVNAGSYNNISGIGSDPGCISTNCSPSQMAQTDAFQWNTTNAQVLPAGSGTVTQDDGLYTITLNWTELGGVNVAASTQTFVLTFQP